ncbi:MAG: bifunctional riboflavin kinase/FAD synthetase [Myxococcales bacterium]|nr:bifunctional riboflavin kinase/FAD synthetase [Myxococcales bacterium]
MRHIPGSAAIGEPLHRPIVTIGNFDGIHLGHQAILKTVTDRARDLEGEAVVYTFEPHPRKVLRPEKAPALLTTLEQKLELLEMAGVDVVVVEPFTEAFARTGADAFVQLLHQRLRPIEVYVGYDFHFGRDREGSMRMLTEMGPRLGFAVTIIPEVTAEDGDVNSTRIRELLTQGEPERAARMLGRPFTIRGSVVRGDARGRILGFPTANLEVENELLPAAGVYVGHLRVLDSEGRSSPAELPAVINLGRRPTFEDSQRFVVEAHILDWNGDLYGRRVELAFRARLREERRFPSVDALREQIARDVEDGRRRLGAR